ncbi:putative anti-sigma factor [Klebsiella phage KP185]|nr:putative anti-sigma factor [Klebsiella phage KP185]
MKFNEENVKVYTRLITTFGSAKRRHKEFNLTAEYMKNIMAQEVCAYSGEKFNNSHANNPDAMTLERWNNDLGYVMGNVIPVKQKYNALRGNNTIEDLERKANETAARIVRSSDSVKPTSDKEASRWKKISEYERTIASIKTNLRNRENHLSQFVQKEKNGTATSADLELINALRTRISGGKSELAKVERKLSAILASVPNRPSDAEIRVQSIRLIVNSLRRLEKCSMLDKLKLKKGLPLTASFFQLLRGKM